MHTIYHTDAVVLNTYPNNEANKTVILFTRDFGVVRVRAQGVRKSKAKLRSHIVDYSIISADIVKGRGIWRMTSARLLTNPLLEHPESKHGRGYVRMLGLIERFLGEDAPHPELFAHVLETAHQVGNTTYNEKKFDTLILWKCMVLLGYVPAEESMRPLFEKPLFETLPSISSTQATVMITEVNRAIQESHL